MCAPALKHEIYRDSSSLCRDSIGTEADLKWSLRGRREELDPIFGTFCSFKILNVILLFFFFQEECWEYLYIYFYRIRTCLQVIKKIPHSIKMCSRFFPFFFLSDHFPLSTFINLQFVTSCLMLMLQDVFLVSFDFRTIQNASCYCSYHKPSPLNWWQSAKPRISFVMF